MVFLRGSLFFMCCGMQSPVCNFLDASAEDRAVVGDEASVHGAVLLPVGAEVAQYVEVAED